MAGFTDYTEKALLEHLVGKAAYTMPTAYVGLSNATPNEDGTGFIEPSTGSYARKQTAGTDWGLGTGGSISNAASITFDQATASWGGAITHFGIWDASSGGNLLGWAALGTSKTIGTNDTPSFAIGSLTITLD